MDKKYVKYLIIAVAVIFVVIVGFFVFTGMEAETGGQVTEALQSEYRQVTFTKMAYLSSLRGLENATADNYQELRANVAVKFSAFKNASSSYVESLKQSANEQVCADQETVKGMLSVITNNLPLVQNETQKIDLLYTYVCQEFIS